MVTVECSDDSMVYMYLSENMKVCIWFMKLVLISGININITYS